jgi:hypothetical protein
MHGGVRSKALRELARPKLPPLIVLGLAAGIGLFAHIERAGAQGAYRSTPIGGRTTLMGGAGIADGRDGAAAFLNPATIVRVDEGRLTFSVNFYSLSIHSAPRWFRPGRVDTRFGEIDESATSMTDVAFDALPSSLCLFFKTGQDAKGSSANDALGRRPRVGLCFATIQGEELVVSDQTHEQRTGVGITRQSQTVSQRYSRFAIGPTYALHLTQGLAVGASVHASLVSHRSLFSSSATTTGIGPRAIRSTFFSSSRGTSFQLNGIAGATYRFGKQTVGLAVESPSIELGGSGGASRDVHFDDGATKFQSSRFGEGSFSSRAPMRIGIGTAIVDTWGAAEIDFSYYTPLGRAYRANLEGHSVEDSGTSVVDREVVFDDSARARGVVNASAGVEILVSRSLSILGGISTDLSAAGADPLQRGLYRYFDSRQNRVALSAGVGSRGPEGDLLFGTELSHARGDRLTIDSYTLPPELVPTPVSTFRVLLVVAGSTSFRAIRRAVEDVTNVLGPKKPSPPPVK